jgi:hypothetical protein
VADLFVEVSAVGIQGLSGGGTGNGATGSTGPAGATGAQGASGVAGASGVGGGSGDGATGSTGPAGASGVAGSTGTQGASGISGASGYVGSDGATGPSGVAGATGTAGTTGSQGASGTQGASGIAGSSGVDGTSFTIVGTVADSSLLPNPYSGGVGDGYITENLGDLWVWDGSAWLDAGPIVGPAGATGISGATGVRGATGIIGASGISGASGYIGLDGATGISGASGIQGASGASGISGASGYIGLDGATGIAGATGAGLTTTTFTTSSTNEVVVETIDATTYRSAKYDMQITSGSYHWATEFRLLVDNPNVFLTEYGAIGGQYLGTFATYYSPLSNDYSSEINNGGLSVHNNTTVTIYTTNNTVIQGLLSIPSGTSFTLNGSVVVTLSTKFTEADAGIYVATVAQNRFPPLMITRIQWTGTGEVELRFTPTYANSTLKYNRVLIEL